MFLHVGPHLSTTFCGHAGPQFPVLDLGASQNHSPGSHHCTSPHHGMVHHHSAHPNEGSLFDVCAMNDSVVPHTHVIFKCGGAFFVGAVDDCAILNVDPLADVDARHVAADHG